MLVNMWQKEWKNFEEDCKKAVSISKDNLRRLMEDNQFTEYGKRYGFDKIHDVTSFQRRVPVTDYKDYEQLVQRMRQGESHLLTAYEIKHYILTSGSTGEQKKIPLTKEALERCIYPLYYASYAGIEGIEEGKYLHMSVFRMEPPRKETDTILSAAYFRELLEREEFHLEDRYLGGTKLLFSKGIGCVPYVKAWIALCSPDMAGIQAFFLYDVLLFLHWFEDNWKELLEDIVHQRVGKEILLSEDVRKELLSLPTPAKEWLLKVRKECEKGMKGIVQRLFPKVKFVSGVGGSTFFAQEAALRFYLGDIPLHYFSYAASECMMAVTISMESRSNVLIPGSGFFEFIPYGSEEILSSHPETKCIWELEEGQRYEILVTNFSGLYRYRLNDVVKVTGFLGESPMLEICFRKNQAVNVAGEKMDLQTVAQAMEGMGERLGIRICEYSICQDSSVLPGRYLCFYEAEEIQEKEHMFCKEDHILDDIFKKLHKDYLDVRQLELMQKPKVYRVERGTHSECKRKFGAKQAQNKPLQFLSDPEAVRYMKEGAV